MGKKKKDNRRIIGLVVAIILIVGAIIALDNPFKESQVKIISAEEGLDVGNRIPSFSLTDPQNRKVDFLSAYRGQNLVINAWAAWCPFCLREIPDLQTVSNEFDDVTVLFVHRTKTETFETGSRLLSEFETEGVEITDPILLDPEDSFYETFFGRGMPVTLFVDKNGIIKEKKIGSMDTNEIREKVKTHFTTGDAMMKKTGEKSKTSDDEILTLSDGTKYIIHPSKFQSGGPPKDGIPSIDSPKFISASEASVWLPDDELGLGIVYKGEARYYPFRILVSHEMVNDEIQGDPILITYCPLCFTGIAFIREIDGEPVEFGVSGKLYNSELVMYDRKTDSYWPQSLGKAVVGPSTGKLIQKVVSDTTEWKNWKAAHPDTIVLSRDTGFPFRTYDGHNPYGATGDFTNINLRFPLEHTDLRLPGQEIVYGIEVNGKFKAYKKSDIASRGTVTDTVGGESITITFDNTLGSARAQTANGDQIVIETLFWFAWAAFHPETELFTAS